MAVVWSVPSSSKGNDSPENLSTPFLSSKRYFNFSGYLNLDGGNRALVIGFSHDRFWSLKNTLFKGISEPQNWP